jgi:hypothetical protein
VTEARNGHPAQRRKQRLDRRAAATIARVCRSLAESPELETAVASALREAGVAVADRRRATEEFIDALVESGALDSASRRALRTQTVTAGERATIRTIYLAEGGAWIATELRDLLARHVAQAVANDAVEPVTENGFVSRGDAVVLLASTFFSSAQIEDALGDDFDRSVPPDRHTRLVTLRLPQFATIDVAPSSSEPPLLDDSLDARIEAVLVDAIADYRHEPALTFSFTDEE